MRKYYKVDAATSEFIGAVDGATVAVVSETDRNMVHGVDEELSEYFSNLNRVNLNASLAFRLNSGGALLILDMSNIPEDVIEFVYYHELGHIRLGHEFPETLDDSLTAELAADAYASARVSAPTIKAAIVWLLDAFTKANSATPMPWVDPSMMRVATNQLLVRIEALKKRISD